MFIKSADAKIEQVEEGISRQMLGHDEQLMMVRTIFKKGAVGYVHQHPHRQVVLVEKGSFEIQIEDKKSVLNTGDCFFVGPNLKHGAVALEDGILLDIFTPQRADFLPKANA